MENAPKREKRDGRVVVLCNRRRWSWEPFDPLSLSLFFCFSLLKKKRRPPRRRAAAASALDSLPLRSRRENSDPAARRGRGATQQEEPGAGRRPGRWSRLQGQKAISMPPPSLCLLELFFPFFALFHPAKRRKKLSLHLARRRPSKRRRRGFSRGPGGGVRSRAIVRTARSTNSEGHGYEAGRGRKGKEEGDSRCDERTKTTKGEKKTHFLCFSRCPCFPS